MSTAIAMDFVSVAEYLEGEKLAEVRHEYLNGVVFAMAGASRRHNSIAGNVFSSLHQHLEGKPCRPFMGDLKVAIKSRGESLFYYPDIVVECQTTPPEDDYYTTEPKVIIEVLSPSTERIDRREKFWAYSEIDTLEEYVLVDQTKAQVSIYRRSAEWSPEIILTKGDLVLASIDFQMPLESIYRGVDFDERG